KAHKRTEWRRMDSQRSYRPPAEPATLCPPVRNEENPQSTVANVLGPADQGQSPALAPPLRQLLQVCGSVDEQNRLHCSGMRLSTANVANPPESEDPRANRAWPRRAIANRQGRGQVDAQVARIR